MGLFDFLNFSKKEAYNHGLHKTKESIFGKLTKLLTGRTDINDDLLDEIEEILITADVGVTTTMLLIDKIKDRVKTNRITQAEEIEQVLKEEIFEILKNNNTENVSHNPLVIMVVGVNGVGKTTSIGKLAHHYTTAGKAVVLGAADTFRAAATEQLAAWATKANARLVAQNQGSDPASVAFDTIKSALAKQEEVIIIDTAGRLHNKAHLMTELTKIKMVMQKQIPNAPHEVYLVLDASTGQNAMQQAIQFSAATEVTGIILTKLDGTAKGGVVISIAHELNIPVRYIGVGEGIEHLQPFDAMSFVEGIFSKN